MAYKKIPHIAAILLMLLLPRLAKAQSTVIQKAQVKLAKWQEDYPQEKVYLHFDKPYYATGDDIWFKAYVTMVPAHVLSTLSGALNVELIDELDSVKQAIKLPVVAGIAYGDFALSDTLRAGNYRIRAYTNWMRNFGTGYFFDKTIKISSTQANAVYTRTVFNYALANGQNATTAKVTFTNLQGGAYTSREVNYQVIANGKTLSRGKGITDNTGALALSFNTPANVVFKTGQINFRLKKDVKTTLEKDVPLKAVSSAVDVQFFPESGNLVYGLPTKIAFKAVAANGLGTAVTGTLVDDTDTEVTKIATQHLGMGVFILVPVPGKTYRAKLTFADGSQRTVSLPVPRQDGYMLTVNTLADPENIALRLYASPGMKDTEVSIIAQSNGIICYAATSKLSSPVLSAKIPKSHFPRGIVQFTVFNSAGEALNERIAFINKPDDLKLDVKVPEGATQARQKMSLGITAVDPDGKGVVATLSAAVTDHTKVPVNASDEVTILSSILLSSDIKGYIEQPNYYFENSGAQAQSDLDVLMLTQGYRRFEWKNMMADNLPAKVFTPERSLTISGRVHTGGDKPVVGGKVSLLATKGSIFFIDTLTDKDGRFAFKNLVFNDSVRFAIQARTDKNKKSVDIELDNTVPQIVTANPNLPDESVNDTTITYLQNEKKFYDQQLRGGVGNHNTLLKEVIIREKREVLKNSANRNGAGQADQIIKSSDFDKMTCPTIIDCLRGRILGVQFINGLPYSRGGVMQVYLDGFQIDPGILTTMNASDIGSIEVLRSAAYSAIYGASSGALLINTRRGGEGRYSTSIYTPGVITYTPKGFYQARHFYEPQYDSPNINAALADLRTTIFWQPNVITDSNGKAVLTYFNAVSAGTYRVVVEGIDAEGHIGRKVVTYKVQ